MFLATRQPFSFQKTLRFILSPPALLNGRQFEPLLDHLVENEYRRVVEIAGQPVLYGVTEASRGKERGIQARILAGPADAATLSTVLSLVERQFSTSLNLNPFYRLAQSDPVLARLAARFRGMRIPQAPTTFETVISAILEQQVNLSFAHQVKKALIDTYGDHLEFEGRRYHSFPIPAALAIVTPRELRRLKISGPKARYLIGISRATLDGSLDLEGLRSLEPGLAQERLLSLKGVGPWTAQYAGMRALGHRDCLPAADVGLQKAVQNFYGLRKPPTMARVEKLARQWPGWRSYATFYLWLTFWEDRSWREKFAVELKSARKKRAA
jgi:DNA-3-methyladenine glycosylase II